MCVHLAVFCQLHVLEASLAWVLIWLALDADHKPCINVSVKL